MNPLLLSAKDLIRWYKPKNEIEQHLLDTLEIQVNEFPEDKVSELQEEICDNNFKIDKLEDELQDAYSDLDKMTNKLESLEKDYSKLETNYDNLHQQYTMLSLENDI